MMTRAWLWLRSILFRARLERDMQEEMFTPCSVVLWRISVDCTQRRELALRKSEKPSRLERQAGLSL
jgi:hypothetical protein